MCLVEPLQIVALRWKLEAVPKHEAVVSSQNELPAGKPQSFSACLCYENVQSAEQKKNLSGVWLKAGIRRTTWKQTFCHKMILCISHGISGGKNQTCRLLRNWNSIFSVWLHTYCLLLSIKIHSEEWWRCLILEFIKCLLTLRLCSYKHCTALHSVTVTAFWFVLSGQVSLLFTFCSAWWIILQQVAVKSVMHIQER